MSGDGVSLVIAVAVRDAVGVDAAVGLVVAVEVGIGVDDATVVAVDVGGIGVGVTRCPEGAAYVIAPKTRDAIQNRETSMATYVTWRIERR